MPEALPQGRRQQRAVVERDEKEEEDWEGLDADAEEMVKVVQLKVQKGTGGQVCFVLFRNGTSQWGDRMFVPSDLLRDFQNVSRRPSSKPLN